MKVLCNQTAIFICRNYHMSRATSGKIARSDWLICWAIFSCNARVLYYGKMTVLKAPHRKKKTPQTSTTYEYKLRRWTGILLSRSRKHERKQHFQEKFTGLQTSETVAARPRRKPGVISWIISSRHPRKEYENGELTFSQVEPLAVQSFINSKV